jgi:hypothetical protein
VPLSSFFRIRHVESGYWLHYEDPEAAALAEQQARAISDISSAIEDGTPLEDLFSIVVNEVTAPALAHAHLARLATPSVPTPPLLAGDDAAQLRPRDHVGARARRLGGLHARAAAPTARGRQSDPD